MYRPPYSKQSNNTNKMFLDELPDFFHSLSDGKGEVIVMGDFNFHFDSKLDSKVYKLKSSLNDCCCNSLLVSQLIAVVTLWTG